VLVGSLVLGLPGVARAAEGWSVPSLIDPSINTTSATAVSCTSASFCAAAGWDQTDGVAAVDSSGTWSEPVSVGTYELTSVSCASSSFCVALEGAGNAFEYNGHAWSEMTEIGPQLLTEVSCASSSFCLAVGSTGHAAVYNGHNWTATGSVGVSLRSVSCASEDFGSCSHHGRCRRTGRDHLAAA
jgi:hypothetical protein